MSDFFLEGLEDNREFSHDSIDQMPVLQSILNFFITIDWIKSSDNNYHFTNDGLFFIKRATAYGVTVSYLPTFLQILELLFGNPNVLWKRNPEGLETHVNRRMNVWGSGGAHSIYFNKIDEIIAHILETFETAPTSNSDPIVSVLSGELNMFGYILHDPLLKQALGNVATDAIYRDRRISEEEAYDEAKENLSELFEDFEAFLQEIMTMSLSQIRRKSMVHGVSIVDIRRLMNPKVAEIDPMRGIRLAFEPAFESSPQKKNTKNTDQMFG